MPTTKSLLATGELPAVPHLLLALLQELVTSSLTPASLYRTLLHDPALCADLLQQATDGSANSAGELQLQLPYPATDGLQTRLRQRASRQFFRPPDSDSLAALQRIWGHLARLQQTAELMTATLSAAERQEQQLTLACLPLGWLQQLGHDPQRFGPGYRDATSVFQLSPERHASEDPGLLASADWLQQLAPASLAGDALRYLLWESRQLQFAAPLIVRTAAIFRLALPGFGPDDDPLPLLHALGYDKAAARALQRKINARANGAEQQSLRAQQSFQPSQLAAHIEQFAALPGMPPPSGGTLWSALHRHAVALLDEPLLLLYPDARQIRIAAASSWPPNLLQQLQVPLDHPHSQLAAALRQPRPLRISTDTPALIDRQLLRLLDTTHALCLSLQDDQGRVEALLLSATLARPDQQARADYAGRHLSQMMRQLRAAEQRHQHHRDHLQAQQQRRAAELVHEIANPLSVTRNYLQILSRTLENNDQPLTPLNTIRDELARIESLLQDFRSDASTSTDPEQVLDLNATVRQLCDLFDGGSGGVQISTQLDPTLQPFACATDPVRQIVTNLLKNACEAMAGEGQITLRTRAGVNLNGIRHAELRIRDSGPGLPDRVLEQGMLPTATAPPALGQPGRGLGLQIIADLCRQLGASISCRNPLDGGAQFVLLLPCPPSEPEKEF
ncbi:sensor histidine kinase [Motiliproteus sediminis]|uniref:sensor histidine kinase n=1 Tax=Motiliproteus sediminis TaxID=1468178 RepID=UPI001AEF61FA|nr:HAMP domain-containing sensor histidine kinase [Motiliproteus sediminis]